LQRGRARCKVAARQEGDRRVMDNDTVSRFLAAVTDIELGPAAP
jgi:hypothetical protein